MLLLGLWYFLCFSFSFFVVAIVLDLHSGRHESTDLFIWLATFKFTILILTSTAEVKQ